MTTAKKRKGGFPPQTQPAQPGQEHAMAPEPEYIRADYVGARKLERKHCLISGADSGIGRAVAVHFAAEGAATIGIVCMPEEHEDARRTRELVETRGARAVLFEGDVTDVAFPRTTVNRFAAQTNGTIDVLVNNAAAQWPQKDIVDVPFEQLDRTFRTNFYAYFLFTQAALPHIPRGGSILNTTSVTAYRGSAGLLDYSATKGAIVAFTRSLSQSLIEKHIRVNGVAPGPIWTPLIPASFDAEKVASFGTHTPMGRAGQPSEVAPCYVFLASADATYMTGQILHPNGGDFIST